MKIKVNFLPAELSREVDLAIVVDVLRATSTIVTALHAGASRVLPVETAERAFAMKQREPWVLLAGESGGHMIPGFDLGNSPLDFKEKLVRGREIVMKTTNGTSAALHSKGARKIVAASFLNLARVIEEIKKESGSVVIQCAGSGGAFSMEDVLLAGAAASAFEDRLLDDASRAAVFLFRSAKLPLDQFLIDNCDHAKKLFSIGYFEDVVFCAKINMYDLLPVWRENGFVRG